MSVIAIRESAATIRLSATSTVSQELQQKQQQQQQQ
jgi:hypothetical protein